MSMYGELIRVFLGKLNHRITGSLLPRLFAESWSTGAKTWVLIGSFQRFRPTLAVFIRSNTLNQAVSAPGYQPSKAMLCNLFCSSDTKVYVRDVQWVHGLQSGTVHELSYCVCSWMCCQVGGLFCLLQSKKKPSPGQGGPAALLSLLLACDLLLTPSSGRAANAAGVGKGHFGQWGLLLWLLQLLCLQIQWWWSQLDQWFVHSLIGCSVEKKFTVVF